MTFGCRFEYGSTCVLSSSQMWKGGQCCTRQHPNTPVGQTRVQLIADRDGASSLGAEVIDYIEIWKVRSVHLLINKLITTSIVLILVRELDLGNSLHPYGRFVVMFTKVRVSHFRTLIWIPSTPRSIKCPVLYGSDTKILCVCPSYSAKCSAGKCIEFESHSFLNLSRF